MRALSGSLVAAAGLIYFGLVMYSAGRRGAVAWWICTALALVLTLVVAEGVATP